MATTIITKNGSGAPATGDLVQGELAVDLTNKSLYSKDTSGNIVEISAGGISEAPVDGKQYAREDATWTEVVTPDAGIPEAPEDGKQYAREDATWTEVVTPDAGIPEAPEDGKQYAREDATWTEVVAATSLPASAITDGAMAYTGSINITGDIAGTNVTASSGITSAGNIKGRDFIETVREPRYQGGTATLEINLANNFTMNFSANPGFIVGLSGAPSGVGDAYGFTLTLDTTGMAGVSWDAKIKWSTGIAPVLAADSTYVFTFLTTDNGTTFKGFVGGQAFA